MWKQGHLVAQCPYNSDNDDDNKKNKKDEKEKKEKKDKMTFKKKGGSYMVTWDSDASQVMMMTIVMITRPPKRRHLQALLSMKSLLSSTLHHASWLRPLKYKLVMMEVRMNMIVIVIMIMMNPLKMN